MDDCISLTHPIEYVSESEGIITYRCKHCDKTFDQYQDCTAGR